jgi:hypothetical protein
VQSSFYNARKGGDHTCQHSGTGVAETSILHDTLEFAESWTKEMTIYTPTDAPSEVQQLVRELVGPRTGGDTLKFATIAPDPISWLAH